MGGLAALTSWLPHCTVAGINCDEVDICRFGPLKIHFRHISSGKIEEHKSGDRLVLHRLENANSKLQMNYPQFPNKEFAEFAPTSKL